MKNANHLFLFLLTAIYASIISSCNMNTNSDTNANQNIDRQTIATTEDGKNIELFTLKNANGMEVGITNYGGILVSILAPDRDGNLEDIVLGFDDVTRYRGEHPYFGSIVGRYANRIKGGKFTLDGKEYTLAQNNGENHLHGGIDGFDSVIWEVEEIQSNDSSGLRLTYLSKDGEEGYPGNLSAAATYYLTDENELRIDYEATTDAPTVLNLTNHTYFNLAGAGSGDILGHQMMINADHFTPTDEGLIPTGEIRSVAGTPMDFRTPTPIGERIDQDYEPLVVAGGYDHNYVLNKTGEGLELAARVTEQSSGRVLEVFTTQPGVQFYSGNFLNGSVVGKGGVAYQKRAGFCLETQHFPDSPNQPEFPSVVLRPGETYRETTVFKFSAE